MRSVSSELQELDRLVPGGAAVGVQGEEQRGKDAALRGTGADGQRRVSPASRAASCQQC